MADSKLSENKFFRKAKDRDATIVGDNDKIRDLPQPQR